jgi:hypothetical protein
MCDPANLLQRITSDCTARSDLDIDCDVLMPVDPDKHCKRHQSTQLSNDRTASIPWVCLVTNLCSARIVQPASSMFQPPGCIDDMSPMTPTLGP